MFYHASEKYGDLEIPKKVESIIKLIAFSTDPLIDFLIGYFINPFENEISSTAAGKVKPELEGVLKED